ncbi:MAG: transposase [Candidatus Paceibacterota bacterium]
MERKFKFETGEYYHVYNRGIARLPVFYNDSDYERFINLLYLCNSSKPVVYRLIQGDPLYEERGGTLVDIVAYVLMPNHYHLILREKVEGGIIKFLSKVMTAYTMYFNTKNERGGQLFCKPFRAKHINEDAYFRWVLSYIHLNPLGLVSDEKRKKDDMNKYLKEYKYSSFIDYYVGKRKESNILEMSCVDEFEIEDLNKVSTMEQIVETYK